MEEFNLSEKARNSNILLGNKPVIMYMEYDVKEFIRILKEEPWDIGKRAPNVRDIEWISIVEKRIDKLAGDKLI